MTNDQRPVTRLFYDEAKLRTVCEGQDLRLVVLYGSRATGSPPPTPESDLDLAAAGRRPCSTEQRWAWYEALAEVFDAYAVDLVCLPYADPLFRWEILREGVLLYGDPLEFLAYRAFAYRDFVDSADLRALEDALFRKKMAYIQAELDATS